jgi:hypothetical protein
MSAKNDFSPEAKDDLLRTIQNLIINPYMKNTLILKYKSG